MEEDQELKHVCKLCNKSFPCGRSLGGHMRSHVINSAETDKKLNKIKLSSVNNGGGTIGTPASYDLRDNPKKTGRFADSNGKSNLLHDKLCKECGKGFQSWKALFGHMKCHSSAERFSSTVEEDSWTSAANNDVAAEVAAPNRKKRSRRVTRYMATATSSLSIANNNNNGSSSVCENVQEQEVAMCLMMLSRDVGNKGSGLNSVAESSDEVGSSIRSNGIAKNSWSDGGEAVKFRKLRNGKLESAILGSENSQFDTKQSEFGASGVPRNGSKSKLSNKSDACVDGFGNDKTTKKSIVEDGSELGENLRKEFNSKKSKKQWLNLLNPELGGVWETGKDKGLEKKSKFECTTCNKTFHSYQALGGHRASHKKIKGCFASKIESAENSIETEISPDPTDDTKMIKALKNEDPIETSPVTKKNNVHECPFCFKVFTSGQALGGHKRSHLVGSNQSTVIQKRIPEIRDLLDLNLPAPVEEESSTGFKPWWVEIASNHKHEPLFGLIS